MIKRPGGSVPSSGVLILVTLPCDGAGWSGSSTDSFFTRQNRKGWRITPNAVGLGAVPKPARPTCGRVGQRHAGQAAAFLIGSDSIYPRVVGAILVRRSRETGGQDRRRGLHSGGRHAGSGGRPVPPDRCPEAGPDSQHRLREDELGIHSSASRRGKNLARGRCHASRSVSRSRRCGTCCGRWWATT